MSGVHKLYVDTNIFIIAFEGHGDLSTDLSAAMLRGGRVSPGLVTSVISYAELMAGPYRDGDDELLAFYGALFSENGTLETIPIDKTLLDIAARLRAKYRALKLPDAIHVASALRAGCFFLMSREARFPNSFSIQLAPHAAPAEVKVLLPDADGLVILRRLLAP